MTITMDGPPVEHSDSDSGDSWTLLDNSTYADETPDISEIPVEGPTVENREKDEDTDGISIISDSEPESPSPCQMIDETTEETHLSEADTTGYVSIDTQSTKVQNAHEAVYVQSDHESVYVQGDHESVKEEDDFLGDNRRKYKTYVHRRNKRLSTVLNIVVLASFITAVGIAIGHMWGAKTDCTLQNTPGVNKILSRLYKLQEENAYLRSKLKEITALNNYQANYKAPMKQNKCRKVFEESLNSDSSKRITTCVDHRLDSNDKLLKNQMIEPSYEKDFVNGNEKNLKKAKQSNEYKENGTKINKFTVGMIPDQPEPSYNKEKEDTTKKSYADSLKSSDSGMKRVNALSEDKQNTKKDKEHGNDFSFNTEEISTKKDNNKYKTEKNSRKQHNVDKNLNKRASDKLFADKTKTVIKHASGELGEDFFAADDDFNDFNRKNNINIIENTNDSEFHDEFTSDKDNKWDRKFNTKNYQQIFAIKEDIFKNVKGNYDSESDSASDDDLKKDNRYTGSKYKQEKKKYDRNNSHKKMKKRNKYEQWEMNGGLLKDYENIYFSSSQESTIISKEGNLRGDPGEILYNGSSDVTTTTTDGDDEGDKCAKADQKCSENTKTIQYSTWADKRANFRKEARKRLEEELFDESPPTAGWYFKRMRKREQCRAKGDNSTYRKLSKRFKNYKTKH